MTTQKTLLKSLASLAILSLAFTIMIPAVRADVWGEIQQNLDVFEDEGVYNLSDRDQPLQTLIVRIVGIVLTFLGVIFLCLTVYGGILWMTASGNEEQAKKARKVLVDSIIGLGIVIASYAITWFVVIALYRASYAENL